MVLKELDRELSSVVIAVKIQVRKFYQLWFFTIVACGIKSKRKEVGLELRFE